MLNVMSPMTVRLAVAPILDERKISTRDFAEKAGLTYNQALSMRRGVYTRIDLDVLRRVCEALNVMPGDLFAVEEVGETG
jgi:guanylate kinase